MVLACVPAQCVEMYLCLLMAGIVVVPIAIIGRVVWAETAEVRRPCTSPLHEPPALAAACTLQGLVAYPWSVAPQCAVRH